MTATTATPRPAAATDAIRRFLYSGGIVWVLVAVLFLAAATISEDFRTLANLSNLSRQATILALVAVGQFLVVLTAGIDLSVGATAKLASLLAAITMAGSNGRLLLGLAAALTVGVAAGAVNGLAIVRLRVPPFVTTLGTLAVLQGLALFIAPTPTGRTSPLLISMFSWQAGPLYLVVAAVALIWGLTWWGLHQTAWGRHIYATGGNAEVARVTGVPVERSRFSVYALSGLLAAVAGIVIVAKAGVGDPNAGLGLEFESLAAVVVGGTSLFGGRGRLRGVLGGVVLLAMIGNIFNLVGIDVWYQQLIKGLIILVAGALYVRKD